MSTQRLFCTACTILVLGFLTAAASGQSTQGARVPIFEPDFTLTWDGGTIHDDNYGAVPCAVDWDGDSKKDLLVGVFYNGNIFFYKNYGTNQSPLFRDRVTLRADGQEISLTYG